MSNKIEELKSLASEMQAALDLMTEVLSAIEGDERLQTSEEYGFKDGDTLNLYQDPKVTCKVHDAVNNRVLFEGEVMSLSRASRLVLHRDFGMKANYGPGEWTYNGKRLTEIHTRKR